MIRQLGRTFGVFAILFVSASSLPWSASCSAAMIIGTPVLLSTLVDDDGGTVIAGDKTFSGFTYSITGDMPGPSLVNVIPIQDDFGNFGIRFQGAFIDTTGVPGGSDALITYNVTAAAGRLISDAHLQGNPTRLGQFGSISVTETFLPLGQSGEFTMKIYDDQNINPPKLVDSTIFTTPTQTLNVQKDILALAKVNPNSPTAPSTVTLSFVDQTFSQVPEPASVLLGIVGIAGVATMRRRRTF